MVAASLSRRGAGVTAAVEALSRCVDQLKAEVRVYGFYGPDWDQETWRGAQAEAHLTVWPRGLGYAPSLPRSLCDWAPDVMHLHGLWLLNSHFVSRWGRQSSRPYIISPHGMLAPEALRYSRLKKNVASVLYHSRALTEAACLHATSEQEYLDIRAYGLRQPVAIVPHGIELPSFAYSEEVKPIVLSLGRLHPIKGLDRLIEAWSWIEPDFGTWRLEIVGPDQEGYREKLLNLVRHLGLHRVSINSPAFGEEKVAKMCQAGLFVLPSLNENFAMTVAESLACGTPVIATKGAPWVGLETNRCGWWVDHGPEPMAAALRMAMTLSPEERRAMGARGRAWMEREFSWPGIATKIIQVYRWLIDDGEVPEYVSFN